MSGNRALESASPLLTDHDLRRILKVGRTTFYKLKKLGRFRALLVSPQLTPATLYSPALVQRWIDGEALNLRSFGAGRRSA